VLCSSIFFVFCCCRHALAKVTASTALAIATFAAHCTTMLLMLLLLSLPLFSLVDCCCFIFSNFSLLSGRCAIANVAATTFAVAVTPLLFTTLQFCQHHFYCCILLLSPLSLPPVDCCILKLLCCGCCSFSKFVIADAVVLSCLCCCTALAITALLLPSLQYCQHHCSCRWLLSKPLSSLSVAS